MRSPRRKASENAVRLHPCPSGSAVALRRSSIAAGAVPGQGGPGAFEVPPHQRRVSAEPGVIVACGEQSLEGALQRPLGIEGRDIAPGEPSVFR